jgi:biopolymer transport protein ExbD
VSLLSNWRERHPRPSGPKRVIILIVLLVLVVIVMLKAPEITRGFSAVFFPSPDTTEAPDG